MQKILLLFIFTALLTSCIDNDIVVPAKTSFPFGQINYTDSALFDLAGLKDIVKPNHNGVLSVFSEDSIEVITPEILDTLFKLEAQNVLFNEASGIEMPANPSPGTLYDLPKPIMIEVEINGLKDDERIDSLTFANCNVRLNIDNAPAGTSLAEAYWEIIELTENATPTPKRIANKNYDISGCKLKPTHKSLNGKIIHTFTVKITGKVPPMEHFAGNVIMDCKKIQSMFGFVGHKVINIKTTEFVFSDKLQDFSNKADEVFFNNPIITFDYNNTFNVPIILKINEIKIDGKIVKLSKDSIKTMIGVLPNTKGTFVFDNSNTENNDLSANININTKHVSLATTAIANPSKNGFLTQNDITNEDRLDVTYRVDLPLEGYVRNLQFEQIYDNVKFEVEDVDWQTMTFAFSGTNSILLDFYIDLYAFDDASQPVLLTANPIHIPAAHSEQSPMTVNKAECFTILDKAQIDAINKKQQLMIKYRASTKNIDNHSVVRLLAKTGLNLNLLVGAEAEVRQ